MITLEEAAEIGKKLQQSFYEVKVDGTRESPVVIAREHRGDIPFHRSEWCEHDRKVRTGPVTAAIRKDQSGEYLAHPQHQNDPLHKFDYTVSCKDCDVLLDYEFRRGY